jgi:hypothetical protein
MTEEPFRTDSYLKICDAPVLAVDGRRVGIGRLDPE